MSETPFEEFEQWYKEINQFDPDFTEQVFRAGELSWKYHLGQTRKFSGEPYFVHPFEVARKTYGFHERGSSTNSVCAALLHDTLEDTDISEKEIRDACGKRTLDLVRELTNPSKGSTLPRHTRKKMDRDHLKNVSNSAKVIKLIDRTVNLRDMCGAEPDFRQLYANESYWLWKDCLKDVHPVLERDLLEHIILLQKD